MFLDSGRKSGDSGDHAEWCERQFLVFSEFKPFTSPIVCLNPLAVKQPKYKWNTTKYLGRTQITRETVRTLVGLDWRKPTGASIVSVSQELGAKATAVAL